MDHATAQLVNQLIRYLQKTPPLQPRPLPLLIEPSTEVPARALQIVLPRIWRNGFAELFWPKINSPFDATLVLHRASVIVFLYAVLIALAYLANHSPWTALLAFAFFTLAGIALRSGLYPAATSLLVYSAVTTAGASITGAWSFRTVILTALPLFLIAWSKARLPLELRPSRWSKFTLTLVVPAPSSLGSLIACSPSNTSFTTPPWNPPFTLAKRLLGHTAHRPTTPRRSGLHEIQRSRRRYPHCRSSRRSHPSHRRPSYPQWSSSR